MLLALPGPADGVALLAIFGSAEDVVMLALPGPAEGVALPAREICLGSWSPSGDRGEEPLHKRRDLINTGRFDTLIENEI